MENAQARAATRGESETGEKVKADPRHVNFTNAFIKEVPLPKTGREHYWDTKERNLGLRVTPKGRTLIIRVRVTGESSSKVKERNLDAQNDVKAAREEAAARRIELRNGIDRDEERKRAADRMHKEEAERKLQKVTLNQALENYIAARAEGKPLGDRTIADYRGMMRGMLVKVKDTPLEEFTRPFCAALIKELAADIVKRSQKSIKASGDEERTERTGVRANYALRLIRVLCRTYRIGNQEWGKYDGFDFPWREEKAKKTTLDSEYNHGTAIWNELSKHRCDSGADFIKAVLLTGCRRNELSGLKVEQVNLAKRTITLPTTKNGSQHVIQMSDQLVELITPLMKHAETRKNKKLDRAGADKLPGEKVFPGSSDPRKLLIVVGKAIGEEFTCHSLRKYFADSCMAAGVPYPVIKACLNHSMEKSRDVTLRHYAHAKPGQMRAAWQKHADAVVPTTAEIINLDSRRSAA